MIATIYSNVVRFIKFYIECLKIPFLLAYLILLFILGPIFVIIQGMLPESLQKFYSLRKRFIWKMVSKVAIIVGLVAVMAVLLSMANMVTLAAGVTTANIKIIVALIVAYWFGGYEEWQRRKVPSTSTRPAVKKRHKCVARYKRYL